MTSAKITRCNHYFHGVCLRKWLYVQDRCPFCHEIIMNQDPSTTTATAQQAEQNDDDLNENNVDGALDEDGVEVLEENLDL